MEGNPRQPHITNTERISRRNFIIGGVSSAAALAAMGELYREHEDLGAVDEKSSTALTTEHTDQESIETSDSIYWNGYVDTFKDVLSRDSARVIERIDILTTIQEYVTLPGITSEIVRKNIEGLVPAMSFVESRFDPGEVSEVDAFGILQLMRKAWEEHHKEGELMDRVVDQIKVAARLLEQTYRHITQDAELELGYILAEFFDGNRDQFEDTFLTPAIIDGYHAGMERVSELIKKFVIRFPEPQTLRELSPSGKQLTGHDVFYGFIYTAKGEGWDPDYSDRSVEYTAKTYAANEILIEALTKYGNEVQFANTNIP